MSIRSNILFVLFKFSIFLFSVFLVYSLLRKIFKSLTKIMDLSISQVIFFFMYFECY